MLKYTLRRLLATVPVIFVVALVVFSILYVAPGDPAVIMAGESATPEAVEQVRQALGLDRDFVTRFFIWIGHVAHGDLGMSIYSKLPVSTLIVQRVMPTISLVIVTMLIAIIVAIPLGAVGASMHGSLFDQFAMLVSVLGFSIPSFVVGYVLAYQFGLQLGWLPIQGYKPLSAGLWPHLSSVILPASALAFLYIALIARITRSAMLDVLSQDYIRTARAKGLSERVVLFLHGLKNAAVPISTVIGLGFASLLGGAVVIETVFAYPGLGLFTISAIMQRDYPVIQGALLLFSLSYVFVNLAIDILYAVFDPRIRY